MRQLDVSPGNVLVIGAAGLDIIGQITQPHDTGTSNPARIRTSFGGVARNVAENLARLGEKVQLITVVGDDFYGKELLDITKKAGVDIQPCEISEKHPTGCYLAILNERGDLQVALDNMQIITTLDSNKITQSAPLFDQASLVFIDANLQPKTMRTVVRHAQAAQIPICADPTSVKLSSRLKPILDKLYLVTPNMKEASALCNDEIQVIDQETALQAARYLVSYGVKVAVITMAEFGVCFATPEISGSIPAIRTKVIDPTGVGDALTGAVLFGLLNNIPIDESLRLGVSAAALTLKYPGSVFPELSLELLYDQLII